ncbi:MAG: HD domain-containing protein [Bacteroidales bacterium]|nr:HD domain-containing protein [Bacteroidales bacterium]
MQIKVSRESLAEIKNWFSDYVDAFKKGDPEIQENIELKEDHTRRVCKEILKIGESLGLTEEELNMAEIIALLHDVGRFEQYARYRTFKDSKSENHAELGVKIIEEKEVLKHLNDDIQDLIIKSIRYHNHPTLPGEERESLLFYSRLLRDADKLDIWKVVTDYYSRQDMKRNTALELELPDSPGYSEEVVRDLKNKKSVHMKNVRNLNDFKLLQAGWVFDINFEPSLEMVKQRRYLEKIREALPETTEIDEIFEFINNNT